ncbi:MAG TPA: hypothetical protein PKD73_06125 [Burkholderiaceae bacterium]|nr:hypothetical protein [Burkholderiaceae bacterium]
MATQTTTTAAAAAGANTADSKAKASAKAAKTYTVGNCRIDHDGERYESGDAIELTAAQAARLGALVTPAKE